jgi:hypothetical protein
MRSSAQFATLRSRLCRGVGFYVDVKPSVASRRGLAGERVSFLHGCAIVVMAVSGAKRRTPVVVVREPRTAPLSAGRSRAGGHRLGRHDPPVVVGRPGPQRRCRSRIGSVGRRCGRWPSVSWSGQASSYGREGHGRALNSVNAVRVVPHPVHQTDPLTEGQTAPRRPVQQADIDRPVSRSRPTPTRGRHRLSPDGQCAAGPGRTVSLRDVEEPQSVVLAEVCEVLAVEGGEGKPVDEAARGDP